MDLLTFNEHTIVDSHQQQPYIDSDPSFKQFKTKSIWLRPLVVDTMISVVVGKLVYHLFFNLNHYISPTSDFICFADKYIYILTPHSRHLPSKPTHIIMKLEEQNDSERAYERNIYLSISITTPIPVKALDIYPIPTSPVHRP